VTVEPTPHHYPAHRNRHHPERCCVLLWTCPSSKLLHHIYVFGYQGPMHTAGDGALRRTDTTLGECNTGRSDGVGNGIVEIAPVVARPRCCRVSTVRGTRGAAAIATFPARTFAVDATSSPRAYFSRTSRSRVLP